MVSPELPVGCTSLRLRAYASQPPIRSRARSRVQVGLHFVQSFRRSSACVLRVPGPRGTGKGTPVCRPLRPAGPWLPLLAAKVDSEWATVFERWPQLPSAGILSNPPGPRRFNAWPSHRPSRRVACLLRGKLMVVDHPDPKPDLPPLEPGRETSRLAKGQRHNSARSA